jgi:hypothetical protein
MIYAQEQMDLSIRIYIKQCTAKNALFSSIAQCKYENFI